MLVEGMRHLAVACDQPQPIRIARRLDAKREEERRDRLARQVQIAAKMTKPAMAIDRRYVDATADCKRTRRHDTVICAGKRPDKCTKFRIGAINRAACRKDGPPRLEAIPCLVDFLITRTKDRLEVPIAKTRPSICIPVR